jgi:hypothetical protein
VADADSGGAFYESRWFKGTAAVVALAGAVAALVGPVRGAISDLFSSETPRVNTEIVFDSSAAMKAPFGEAGTKLDAAKHAVADYARPFTNQGLAFRSFGGCGQNGKLAVDFGADHGDDVAQAAAAQQPQGGSDLNDAVRAAIDDLTALPGDVGKHVVVFTGAVDQCGGAVASARDINDFLQGSGVSADFRLIGVSLSDQDKAQLEVLKNALGKAAETHYAYTPGELQQYVKQITPGTGATGASGQQPSGSG